MEIKFISNNKVLDLAGQKLSVSESNSKVSDKMFTKYLFPFEFYMDEEFKRVFGDYSSPDAYKLPKIIEGYLFYENKYNLAKMEVGSGQGDYITCQIDFGFEEIPNFDKMLKDLPLEKFDVPNIHTFAADICGKKYPQTNFNFPRLYNDQFSPEDKLWDAYNGFLNDMNDDGTALRNNYIAADGEIYNQNIIHPLPHILYLLKTGFKDAGYNLDGDILTDPFLAQQWVYSATEYFSRLTQKKYGLLINSSDYISYFFGISSYLKGLQIEKKGKYKITGFFNINKIDGEVAAITLNGNKIWSYYGNGETRTVNFNIDVTTQTDNSVVTFKLTKIYQKDPDPVVVVDLFGDELSNDQSPGEDNGVITNLNRIDLTRAVPEITFGELVNRIRNFLNYDVSADGNTILMNKIGASSPTDIKVLPPHFEELNPKINYLNKKSFALTTPSWENEEKPDSIFYDSSGVTINKKPNDETTVIPTDTYVLPVYVAKPQGQETGVIKSYDTNVLQLVKYDGKTGIQNNAKASPELTFPNLFYTNWEKWLRGRLNSNEFEWSFVAEDDELNFSIKDFIGCYQNIHIIKEMTKDYTENSVTISLKTETVN
jgi:hypothetical protein